jgi:hypothetical protein
MLSQWEEWGRKGAQIRIPDCHFRMQTKLSTKVKNKVIDAVKESAFKELAEQ